ncbi:MAG: cyclodeaminase/cyclohydrolase family protein [Saccharofermentans sp.]|nr:cyclodeaminase/cyclohydrolase family protein [Saccharofermentans sp.]
MLDKSIKTFTEELCSAAPVPGGGGASALAGALSAALASMVGNLTSGKKKYAEYQEEIESIIAKSAKLATDFEDLINKDAVMFEPLSKAYGIPKEEPGRDELLEKCLMDAASAPAEMVDRAQEVAVILTRLADIGSRLAISDVGTAAALCSAAAKGAAMNVYINTKLLKNRDVAEQINEDVDAKIEEITKMCDQVYSKVELGLKPGKQA